MTDQTHTAIDPIYISLEGIHILLSLVGAGSEARLGFLLACDESSKMPIQRSLLVALHCAVIFVAEELVAQIQTIALLLGLV